MRAYGKYRKTTAKDRSNVKVHRVIVESVLGHSLPTSAEVHHVDGNRGNNAHFNLVVCPNRSYHQLLHYRTNLLEKGINPDTHHICSDCGQALPHSQFSKNRTRMTGMDNNCKSCASARQKERYNARSDRR